MTTSLASSVFDSLRLDAVADQEALRQVYDVPGSAAVRKQMTELTEQTQRLIGCSSLVLVASVDAEGNCDVSPRGGPAGFVTVLDARTVAIPDATGNRRLDTLQNVVATGRAGLLFVIPGCTTTLRVNGRACIFTRPELLTRRLRSSAMRNSRPSSPQRTTHPGGHRIEPHHDTTQPSTRKPESPPVN
jgi:uncharacterized protein